MEFLKLLIDWVLHVDHHLDILIQNFGIWFYVLMFLVIFCETGLVVTPFLPGDSLLFALGAFAARGSLSLPLVMGLIPVAAILGDLVNYSCGKWLGPRIFRGENVRLLNRKHLDRTQEFYARYGAKTIILARFVPIVRTFAPFVAGAGNMNYARFWMFNVTGAITWVGICLTAGYIFGNIKIVRDNFLLVTLGIIFVSLLPVAFEWWRERRQAKSSNTSQSAAV